MNKPLTVRFERDELKEIDEASKALGVSQAEVIRRVWRNKSGAKTEEIHELLAAVAATVSELADRQPEGKSAPLDLSPALQKIEALAAAQARTERAIGSLIDAVEKLQNSAGYRPQPSPQQAPTNSQTGAQTSQQTGSAANMTFTAWKMANPMRDGETPAEFNARSRAEFTAAGGRL